MPRPAAARCPHPAAPPVPAAIRVGLPWHLRHDAARLIWAAFGRQIAPGLNRRAGIARIRRGLQRDRVIVALDASGRLAGLTGLRGPQGGVVADPAPPRGRRGLAALIAGSARWPLGWPLEWPGAGRTPDLVLDCLVVAPDWRGQGIAGALIDAALAEADRRGHPGLRAEVAPGNAAAMRAYGRAGLTADGTGPRGWRPGRRTLRRAVPG